MEIMRSLLLLLFTVIELSIALVKSDENSQVQVRAVFINCEPDTREDIPVDNEANRFEREELFRHSVLQACNKKIALTVKIASDPSKFSGDEFIPIEHVFRGANKRVRLLDPYVLRLRRELPLQAYKLRKIATVNGVIANRNDELTRDSKDVAQKFRSRTKRSFTTADLTANIIKSQTAQGCDLRNNTISNNVCLNKRDKRHQQNVVEGAINEVKYPRWSADSHYHQDQEHKNDVNKESRDSFYKTAQNEARDRIETIHRNVDYRLNSEYDAHNLPNQLRRSDSWISNPNKPNSITTGTSGNTEPKGWFLGEKRELNIEHSKKLRYRKDRKYANSEEFDMYEIGNPDLLYSVEVQLFEKLTTPDGKTVWNDMTKGEPASVSTLSPEWVGQDMNVRYRPTEWIPREDFTLPLTSLCLLTPLPSTSFKIAEAESVEADDFEKKYIVVPKEDILDLENENENVQKRDDNSSNVQLSTSEDQPCRRRVMIRTSRAIFGSKEDSLNIAINDGEQFLTMPLRRSHHAQLDLEARADENQLVPIGSSGRIMTVVADSSRRTRTTLTVQVTNTGLAAAKFRAVVTRDCGLEFMGLRNKDAGEAISDDAILLPPRHTRNIRLNVPTEMPADVAHCFVSLVNEEDESVAVRDVTIKKGDRCFCVWHCECVCLNEDPKLLCREMAEARQIAAGLPLRERGRHARSVCYRDVVSVNMLVTAFGVIVSLIFFGLVKGCLGLIFRCVGSWGLHRIVQMPRKLDHYYESSLRGSPVVYDSEGWPVHPNTKERTVQLVSKPMEFIINIIFFVTSPCLIIYDILKEIYKRCCKKSDSSSSWNPCEKDKNCYSSHDIQGTKARWRQRRGRHHEIKKWMSPEAEDLSSNIWQGGIPGKTTVNGMFPLLQEDFCHSKKIATQSYVDSEGDDTEYVLMQMQKSKESLAKTQRNLDGSEK